jgi:hypothetical protein
MGLFARIASLFGCVCISVALLLDCSGPFLNLHTLDLAATVDDVATRQVIFNLAKTAENQYALPSQVQITNGQVSMRTSVTPTVTVPFNNAITSTSQVASQVVGASGALTTTTTNIGANQRVDSTAGVSGVMEDLENWNIYPVIDPEQLRRLQVLYQYGAGYITAEDVLCLYPVPQLPEKTQENKSDLQTLADAILRVKEKRDQDRNKPDTSKPDTSKPDANKPKTDAEKPKLYIRGEFPRSCFNFAKRPIKRVERMFVGLHPDPAFLKPPGCILCAFPNEEFKATIQPGQIIYPDRYSDLIETADTDRYVYVPVVLNDELVPTNPDPEWRGPCTRANYYKCRQGKIDWLFVVKDGQDSSSKNARRVGSSHGYTVYTTDDKKFSEFVLAVTEATLQPHEIEKQTATPPPVVQTNPR